MHQHGDDEIAKPARASWRHGAVTPARHALNPILLDRPVISAGGQRASIFLTPASAVIEQYLPLIVAGAAGVFLLSAFVATQLGAPPPLCNLLILLAFSIAALPAISSVWESLSELRIDIDVLMLLGACLAAVIGSPMEGALLLFLFAISGAMEEYSLDRTQAAIVSLHNLMPTEAIVLDGDTMRRVSLRRVSVGDKVLVRPGDRVSVDGVVVEGGSSIDESAITGESLPRDKTAGDAVFAGTLNIQGRLVVEVSKTARDSTLARILELVTDARHKRASVQRLIDRIGPTYSVAVVLASITTGLTLHYIADLPAREATYRAIALLIVCSPCALVIATPVAYLSAIAAAARRGILVKGGVYLETLARARVAVFDKTGTLTTGRVRLLKIITPNGITEDEALRFAGALEASSSHPLAGAVMSLLAERGLTSHDVEDLSYVPGEGASARSNGCSVWIGKASAASKRMKNADQERFDADLDEVYRSGRAASALVIDGQPSILVYEDSLRPDAAEIIARLRASGIKRIDMLTGDHAVVAGAIAEKLGIDGFQANLLPEEKLIAARKLREKHGSIIMVGDGVNDAPALADADVGIAIGSIGADVALEAADIVLMNNSLEGLTWLHAHARRTARIVRQNLTLAIGVIVLLSGFAVAGQIPLPLAVIGHEGSTVLVALNALRLLRGDGR